MRRRYPGHIAKAERQLREYLTRVDVVVEARDARIGATTAHPSLEEWVGARPRVCLSSPDLGRFPRFAGATGYEVTLRPGDCLFLPRMWWHEIDSLSESLSLVRRALDLGRSVMTIRELLLMTTR